MLGSPTGWHTQRLGQRLYLTTPSVTQTNNRETVNNKLEIL